MTTKLRKQREKQKTTLEVVAGAVGTDTGNLSRIERGLQVPSYPLAKKLSAFYGAKISVDELMGLAA